MGMKIKIKETNVMTEIEEKNKIRKLEIDSGFKSGYWKCRE